MVHKKLPSMFAITCLLALICGQQLVTVIYASSLGPPPGLLLSAGNNLPAVTSSSDNGAIMNIPRRALMGSQKAEFIPFIIKGLVFLGVKAATAAKVAATAASAGKFIASTVAGTAIGIGIERAIDNNPSEPPPTVICNGVCNFGAAAQTSVNGCTSEDCLCNALGAGVHPNVFDNTCSTFFHCPGPKRPCGPGTLFNPEFNVCDWPHNVKCAAVKLPA